MLKVDDPFFVDELFLVLVMIFLAEDDFPDAAWEEVELTFLEDEEGFLVELEDFLIVLDFCVEVECLVLDELFEEVVDDFGLVEVEVLTLMGLMDDEVLTLLDLAEDEGFTLLDLAEEEVLTLLD